MIKKRIAWIYGTCTSSNSENLMSSDNSKIYSFFNFGSSTYLYFVTLKSTDGSSIGNRYKSNTAWSNIWGSTQNGDYILITALWTSNQRLILVNTVTFNFQYRDFSGTYLYGWAVEPQSGRYIFTSIRIIWILWIFFDLIKNLGLLLEDST